MSVLDLTLIESYTSNLLVIGDISQYNPAPTNPSFEITIPGYSKKNVTFVPGVVNVFNYSSLDLGCDDPTLALPDGIYYITYSVFPNATTYVEKSFMRTTAIRGKYEQKFLAIDTECSCNGSLKSKLKNQLRDIKLLIEGSIAAANNCDSSTAYNMYEKANFLLDKITHCNCR